jgi:hypothetical protein
VSFIASSTYPQTYESEFPYISVATKNDNLGVPFCEACSFRPWAASGEIASAKLTIIKPNRTETEVPATLIGGRWVAQVKMTPALKAYVAPDDVVDAYGERNADPSPTVSLK